MSAFQLRDYNVMMAELDVPGRFVPDFLEPSSTQLTHIAFNSTNPPSMQFADGTVPIPVRPNFEFGLDETAPFTGPVFLEVQAAVNTTSSLDHGGAVEFDVVNALDGAVALHSQGRVNSRYTFVAAIVYAGVLRPMIAGRWKIKIQYTFQHENLPVDAFDGVTFVVNVRVFGFDLQQVLHLLDPSMSLSFVSPPCALSDVAPRSTTSSGGDSTGSWQEVRMGD